MPHILFIIAFQVGLDIDVQVTSNLKRALIRTASGQMMESISNQSITSNGQCLSYTAVLREVCNLIVFYIDGWHLMKAWTQKVLTYCTREEPSPCHDAKCLTSFKDR